MHISIRPSGTKPKVHRCAIPSCCSNYHCPVCLKFKPTKLSKLQKHLEAHIKGGILFKDRIICRCGLNCRDKEHYHCPVCSKTILRRADMTKHLESCQGAMTAASPEQTSPATQGAALLHTLEPQFDAGKSLSVRTLRQHYQSSLSSKGPDRKRRNSVDWDLYMAGSETVCGAPGINKLEPECVSAHGEVSDVHHTHSSLIKTETDRGSPYTGDLKTEGVDSAELQCMSSLHSDQVKTESVDGEYFEVEDISKLEDTLHVNIKSDHIKYESCEYLVSDAMNTVSIGAAVGLHDQTESGQCAGEPNQTCRNDDINLLTKCRDLYHNCDTNNENTQHRYALRKSINSRKEYIHDKRTSYREINVSEKQYGCPWCEKCFLRKSAVDRHKRIHTASMIIKPSENPNLLNFLRKTTTRRNENEMNADEKALRCTQCGKCFSKRSSLINHKRMHTGEKPCKCTECGRCFTKKSSYNQHMRIHTGEKPYKCTQCGKCFSHKGSFINHQMMHTGEKPCKCTVCGKCFPRITRLNEHMRIHSGEKPCKCPQCGQSFNTQSGLKIHLRIHTGEKPYTCTQCWKCFAQLSALNSHMRVHSGVKPYKCIQCGKCFSHKSHLSCHMRTHSGDKPYKCTLCGKCFSQMSNLNFHKRRFHSGDQPYTCTQCGICFSHISAVNNHMMIHSGEKPHKCTHCGKCFSKKSSLINHMRVHTGENPYKCFKREKCFSVTGSLNVLKRIHSGGKPCKCSECGKCFPRIARLNEHMRIHSGEKPCRCPQCGQCFNTQSNLSRHLRIHTGEKPFKCADCEKCFSRKDSLTLHKRIHSVKNPHKCTHCGKRFSRLSTLKTHMMIHLGE